ncbi:uncharacterized protein LOC144359223 [Saccoglossus kowalevskii]
MSDPGQSSTTTESETLPTAVIVVVAIGAYLVLMVLLLIIRSCLQANGFCNECAPCGKEDGSQQCCDCWVATAEACNCCAYPNMKACLDSICGPANNKCTLANCVSCQACQDNQCCGNEPMCDRDVFDMNKKRQLFIAFFTITTRHANIAENDEMMANAFDGWINVCGQYGGCLKGCIIIACVCRTAAKHCVRVRGGRMSVLIIQCPSYTCELRNSYNGNAKSRSSGDGIYRGKYSNG